MFTAYGQHQKYSRKEIRSQEDQSVHTCFHLSQSFGILSERITGTSIQPIQARTLPNLSCQTMVRVYRCKCCINCTGKSHPRNVEKRSRKVEVLRQRGAQNSQGCGESNKNFAVFLHGKFRKLSKERAIVSPELTVFQFCEQLIGIDI